MKLAITGPQASGKGTQAEILIKKFGLKHISPGAMFREQVEDKTEIGKKVEAMIDSGKLVPNEITMKLVIPVVEQNENILFDGFPRDIEQAQQLDEIIKLDKVIFIDVPDSVSKERIQGRKECDKGHDYHTKYKPPKKEGVCDIDGLPLHTRDDDTDDALLIRLKIYHEQTEPVIKYYEKQGIVAKINGDQPIKKVTEDILKLFNK